MYKISCIIYIAFSITSIEVQTDLQATLEIKMAAAAKDLIVYGPKKELQMPAVSVGEYCLAHLQKYGDKIALVQQEDGSQLTFSDVLRQSKAVAGLLREHGLGSGDTVMLCCGNTLEVPAILIGTMFIGATLAGVNDKYNSDDIILAVKPQAIISNKMSEKSVQDALSKYEPTVPLITWEMLSSCLNDDSYLKDFHLGVVEDPETHVALVICSSGSTGQPKGVEITHFRFLSMLYLESFPPVGPDVEYTILNPIPPCWTVPFYLMLHSLCSGYKLILSKTEDVETIVKTIQKYKVNMSVLGPEDIAHMLKYPSLDKFDLSSMSCIMSTGAVLSSGLQQEAQDKFHNCQFPNTYGLTECDGQLRPAWGVTNKGSTVGTVATNMAAKVVDVATGELLGPNCTGELCFKSWNVFKAYRGNPQATQDMFDEDGFFLSGDLGYYDNEGYFYVVDRVKEVYKYQYIHVSPTDIEAVLQQHSSVLEAAVVGIPHEVDGAHARAFIVMRQGASASADELEKLVQAKLPSYKWLYGGVRFQEFLPRTATGKVKKYLLRQFKEEI